MSYIFLLLSMSQFFIPLLFQQGFEIKTLKAIDFPVFSSTISVLPRFAYLVMNLWMEVDCEVVIGK